MRQQKGISLIGFLIIAILLSAALLLGFKLTPAYLQHLNIAQTLESVQKNLELPNNATEARSEIRRAIQRRFDVQDVSAITSRDIVITQIRNGYEMSADYQITVNIIGNMSLQLKFNDKGQVNFGER